MVPVLPKPRPSLPIVPAKALLLHPPAIAAAALNAAATAQADIAPLGCGAPIRKAAVVPWLVGLVSGGRAGA